MPKKKKRRYFIPEWRGLYKTWTVRLAVIIGVVPQVYQQVPWLNDYMPLAHLTSALTVLLILGRAINQEPAK
jgi:hypothetical protein